MKLKSIALALIISNAIYATDKPTINALAFWGFLDDTKITQVIENNCNVKFAHDNYYTNSEFLNIFNQRKTDYDVIIFSNLIYGSIKSRIPNIRSNLWKNANNYYPYFKNYYKTHNYSSNAAFFTHSMVGFLYNPKLISINKQQSMFDIFKNAKHNDVILVDDSGEIGNMLSVAYNTKNKTSNKQTKLTYANLKQLTQNTKVYITSDFNKIYDNPKFAFAYIWSGDALLYLKKSHKPYKFIMPPKSTSICTDLVVQMKDTPAAKCVANILASPLLLKTFESDSYYFSPYFKNNLHDPSYTAIYNQVKSNLANYHMMTPVQHFTNYYDEQWDTIKLKYSQENDSPK